MYSEEVMIWEDSWAQFCVLIFDQLYYHFYVVPLSFIMTNTQITSLFLDSFAALINWCLISLLWGYQPILACETDFLSWFDGSGHQVTYTHAWITKATSQLLEATLLPSWLYTQKNWYRPTSESTGQAL